VGEEAVDVSRTMGKLGGRLLGGLTLVRILELIMLQPMSKGGRCHYVPTLTYNYA
jgi:hypothetical protein